MRKVLIGLAVFVFTVALVVFIGPQLIPADRLKSDVARQVEAATGRQLTIDGELSFTLLPAPGLSVGGMRLSNIPGAAEPDMLRLDRVTAVVALAPLFSGNIEVDRIILTRPWIDLEMLPDGRASWDFAPRADAGPAGAAPAEGGSGTGASGAPPVALNNVVIRDGTLTFREGDSVETLSGINTVMMAQSLFGPFQFAGGLTLRGVPLDLRAGVGALAVDRAIPVSLEVDSKGLELNVNGVVSGYPNAPRLSGRIDANVADAGATAAALTGAPAQAFLAGKQAALEGTLGVNLGAANITINDLSARFGSINATGALDVSGGDAPRIDLVLNAGQIDLDAMLADLAAAPGGNPATMARPAGGSGTPAPSGERGPARLPAGVAGSVEIKVDNILYRNGIVRQARLAGELSNGALTISQLAAQLPGGSDVSLFGFVELPDSGPAFSGQIEANSDNLRALLGWLDIDVNAVPPERLRKLTASSAIRASAENVTVTDLDLAIDTTRLRGGVTVLMRERPGFGIGLSLDKINLDAYLPKPAETAGAAATQGATARKGDGTAAAPAGGGASGLAALDTFDANVQAKVGELIWRGTTIRGVNVDATLQGGKLALRDASAASLGGARARISGTLDNLATTPRADLDLSIDTANAEGMLRLADVTAPVPIGAAKLDGSLAGDFDALELDVALQALQGTAKVAGTLTQPVLAPAYDVTLALDHPEAARLFALLSGEAPGAAKLGPLALKGALAGSADAVRFDIDAKIGAGSAALKGDLKGLATDAAAGSVSLRAAHPNLSALVQSFAPDYRPALAELGPFALATAADVAPDTIRFDSLEGRAGPVEYKGSGDIALGGPRPKLTASLTTSEIIVDWFLPPDAVGSASAGRGATAGVPAGGGSGGGGAAAHERWSRAPIDLAALHALDADVTLSAPAITQSGIKVDGPKLAAVLADGTLDLKELSGRAYGGTFGMTGRIAAGERPQVRYAMQVRDADAAAFVNAGRDGTPMMGALELLFPVADLDLVSGKIGADIDVRAEGRSEYELVSNLAGTGKMTLANAVVDGIDACRVSDQLDKLNGLEGFLALVGSAQGGQTRIADFAGGYTIDKGIATLPPQTVTADCGVATFAGIVDLPRWTIDLRARATMPAHPKFPGLEIEQKGPLDAPNTRLVNSNAVQQYIIGNAAESIIRQLVPKAAPQAAPQPAPQDGRQPAPPRPGGQQPAPQQPADQFRNLLEGLIRK